MIETCDAAGEDAMDLVRYLFLENPLTLGILLALGTVAAGAIWSRTRSRRTLAAMVAMPLAAGLLVLLAHLVETDRERLLAALDALARAVDTGDAEAFLAHVSADYTSGPYGKDSLAAAARVGLAHVRATAETPLVHQTDGEATVNQTYRFRPAPAARFTLPQGRECVRWEGRFVREADGQWRLKSAVAVSPMRMTPEEAARLVPRAR